MQEFQQRVIEEKKELDSKLNKLKDFMHSEQYAQLDSTNQGLLMVQQVAMENYSDALARRIEMFN